MLLQEKAHNTVGVENLYLMVILIERGSLLLSSLGTDVALTHVLRTHETVETLRG